MSFLRRIGVASVAKFGAVFGVIAGFLVGLVLYAVGGFAVTAMPASHAARALSAFVASYGSALLVIGPVVGAILAFLYFAVLVWLYNCVAPRVGAIRIDLKKGRLNSIGPMSFAKIEAVIGLVLGFVVSCIAVAFIIPIIASISPTMSHLAALSVLLIPVITVAAGACGFVGGIVYAFLYNVVAGWVGGVRLRIAKGTLDRVGVVSLIKVMAVIGAIFGLVGGILSFNPVSLVAVPVTDFIFYAVYAAVLALLFNFLAGVMGGVKLRIS